MANSKQFKIEVNANLSGDLMAQLQTAQNAMNAFKNAGKFSSAFGNVSPKLLNQVSELQRQQKLIQDYKSALREIPKAREQYQKQLQKNSQAAAERRQAAEKVTALKMQLESFQAAQVGLKRTSQEYKNLQTQIKQTKAEIKSANDALKVADTAFKTSHNRTFDAGQNLSRQISQLNSLRSALSSAGVGLNQLGAAEANLRSQINSTNAAMQRQAEFANRRQNFSNATENLSDKYGNFQNSIQTAQTLMSPFTGAAQNAMTYEYALTNVKALTQLKDVRAGNYEKVNAEMSLMDKTFRHLGATTEYTSTQVAESAGFFAMAGWDANRIVSVLPAFMNLATATQTKGHELARLADVFSDDMTAMGLKAGEMITYGKDKNGNALQMEASQYFADTFAYAVTSANLNRESLHESVKYFAPVAKQLGLDTSEMLATTMLTANAGIKGSQMGTAFRAGLIRMVAPPKAAAKALEEMGMSMSDAQKEYQESQAVMKEMGITADTFSGKLAQMAESFAGMDREEKMGKIAAIFGKNAMSAWAEIFENPDKVKQIMEYSQFMKSEGIQGYATDTAGLQRESTQIQFEQLKSSWDAVVNQFGTALLPSIINISQTLAPLLLQFSEWIMANPQIVTGLASIAAGISAIIVAAAGIQLISAAWGMVTASATLASGAITRAVGAMLGANFASLGAAVKGIGTAFLGAARAAMVFVATPIGAAITAIAVAGALLYANWDKVGGFFRNLGKTIYNAFKNAFPMVSALIDKVSDFFGIDFSGGAGESEAAKETRTKYNYKETSGDAVRRHRQDATPEQIETQVKAIRETQKAEEIAKATKTAAAINRHRTDSSKTEIAAKTSEFKQADVAAKNYSQIPGATNLQSTVAPVQSTVTPNVQNAVQTQIDTTQIQNQLNNLGSTADLNSAALSAKSAADANGAMSAEMKAAADANGAMSADTKAMSDANGAMSADTKAMSDMSASAASLTTATSMGTLATATAAPIGGLNTLGGTSTSTSGAVSGLGSAAMSAISGLLSAAASAASSVVSSIGNFVSNIANNYSGGIYRGGAFLSWINEKGPEAIIPLDGSANAINLWKQTGAALGIYQGNVTFDSPPPNPARSLTKINSNIKNFNLSNILPKFDLPKFELPSFENLSKFELPKFELPKFDNILPSFNLPNFELPKLDNILPSFNLPNFELPKLDNILPSFNLPNFELPKFENLVENFKGENTFERLVENFKTESTTTSTISNSTTSTENSTTSTENVTFNVTVQANNPQEFIQDFETQMQDWLDERQRRSLAW